MSDSEDLPDIDDHYPHYTNNNGKIPNGREGIPLHLIESEESDIEVVWEANSSQDLNEKSSGESLPCSSSSVLKNKSVKLKEKPILSDSEEECEGFRVMLPKKKRSKPKPKVLLVKDKDKKRLEKEKEQEMRRLEKERKKQEEERARELRKATNEVQRSVKPGESIKHMTVLLDSVITQQFDALIPLVVAADIKCEVADSLIENSIYFKRELMQQAMGDDLKIKLVSKFIDEDQVIVVLDSDKVVQMVHAQMRKQSGDDYDENDLDFTTWVDSVKSTLSGKKLTLFLYDMEKYFRKIKKNTQQEFRNRVLNIGNAPVQNKRKQKSPNLPDISQTELYGSLIEMQLLTGINYRMIKNVNELGFTLIQYTKAIADAPFKKQRIESHGFDWFALADVAGSVKVEKDGSGLKQLWVEQLQQFDKIGPEMALAISNSYSSPMKLMQAYKSCDNQEEGESLLKNLSMTTGIGPLSRTRKLGSETSKKLYRFFTSTNGDRFLGSTLDTRSNE